MLGPAQGGAGQRRLTPRLVCLWFSTRSAHFSLSCEQPSICFGGMLGIAPGTGDLDDVLAPQGRMPPASGENAVQIG